MKTNFSINYKIFPFGLVLWLVGVGCNPSVEGGSRPEANDGQAGLTSSAVDESELGEKADTKQGIVAQEKKNVESETKSSDPGTETEDSEEEEIKKSREEYEKFVEARTREYRVRVEYSPRRVERLWKKFSRTKVCFHGPDVFGDEPKYRAGKKLAYNINENIHSFLFGKLTSEKMTRVHLGPEINDAKEFELALRFLEMRGRTTISAYDGPDRFISESFKRWSECNEKKNYESKECAYSFHVRQILFDEKHRNALIAFLTASVEKAEPLMDSEPANSFFEICAKKLMKQGVSSANAHNWCGGQVGDSFGYGALNARRKTDEKFCRECTASAENMDCEYECGGGGISLGHIERAPSEL